MLFDWLRKRVKDAVLAGVGDAVAELDAGTQQTEESVTLLRERLGSQQTLPPPVVDVQASDPCNDGPMAERSANGRQKTRAGK